MTTPKRKITPELAEAEYESVIRALTMADDEFGVEKFYILRHKLIDEYGKPDGYSRCD